MLYKGNQATESSVGKKIEAGAYKFRIEEAKVYNGKSIGIRMKIWGEAKEPLTEKMWAFINIDQQAKDALKAETDRRLTTILGKPEISSETELVGKSGWVVLRAGARNAEVVPFGGFYTSAKKSATGSDTILERIQEAVEYDWTKDKFAVDRENKQEPQKAKDDSDSLPF